jgi:TRAP-type uncharacterized transport system fused permease subunit
VGSPEVCQRPIYNTFLIAYTPILFNGPISEVILTIITSLIGISMSAIAMEGYYKKKLNVYERICCHSCISVFLPELEP